jgi:hypothetical protein
MSIKKRTPVIFFANWLPPLFPWKVQAASGTATRRKVRPELGASNLAPARRIKMTKKLKRTLVFIRDVC